MTIQEAIKSGKKFTRKNQEGGWGCYYNQSTGPFDDLVDCDYFVFCEDNIIVFSTSIDLYAEDILADDWEFVNE